MITLLLSHPNGGIFVITRKPMDRIDSDLSLVLDFYVSEGEKKGGARCLIS
jgi:hypothetical protein